MPRAKMKKTTKQTTANQKKPSASKQWTINAWELEKELHNTTAQLPKSIKKDLSTLEGEWKKQKSQLKKLETQKRNAKNKRVAITKKIAKNNSAANKKELEKAKKIYDAASDELAIAKAQATTIKEQVKEAKSLHKKYQALAKTFDKFEKQWEKKIASQSRKKRKRKAAA